MSVTDQTAPEQRALRGIVREGAPAPAAGQGRGGRGLHGRAARPPRPPRTRRGRRPRDPERGRRDDRGRDPLARDLAAPPRHARDHPDPPHGLRDAHVHGRGAEAGHPGRDRASVRRSPSSRSSTSTRTCASRSRGSGRARHPAPHRGAQLRLRRPDGAAPRSKVGQRGGPKGGPLLGFPRTLSPWGAVYDGVDSVRTFEKPGQRTVRQNKSRRRRARRLADSGREPVGGSSASPRERERCRRSGHGTLSAHSAFLADRPTDTVGGPDAQPDTGAHFRGRLHAARCHGGGHFRATAPGLLLAPSSIR